MQTDKRYKGELLEDVSLADYVSWKTSGKAKQLYEACDLKDLAVFLKSLPKDEPLLWIGLGSNLLIRDGGFSGTVIFTQKSLREIRLIDETTIYAQAGVACPTLARFAARHSLGSGEWFAGVPGTIGGALAMNAGAFGGETWNHVMYVDTLNRRGEIQRRLPSEYQTSYREVKGPMNEWFVGAAFKFKTGDKILIQEKIKTLLAKRASTQPTGVPTCGSVFRNPPNDFAARLIEASGLKGYPLGGAQVSEKHANFIVNTGTATAADIEALIDYIAAKVKEEYNIELQREVCVVGKC